MNSNHPYQSLTCLENRLQQLQDSLDTISRTNQQELSQLRHLICRLLIQRSMQSPDPKDLNLLTNLPSPKTVQKLLQQQEKRLQERLQQLQRHSPLS